MVGSVMTCGADGKFVLLQRPMIPTTRLARLRVLSADRRFASSATDILSAAYVARSLAGEFTVLSFWLNLSMLSLLRRWGKKTNSASRLRLNSHFGKIPAQA
ncbi:hypothetical protein PanWU01x14_049900 [Parasponia andersonii]|uniref:Uncharacterized protein n=1 Tax=Parasponia andersonii TaxID=3476 RepID=A0A2P5DMS1_PARAD|nr:hypothetical protein PanWU01x14_049900 [Parasponia andersonii]